MKLALFLIIFPLFPAFLLLRSNSEQKRNRIVFISSTVIALASILFALTSSGAEPLLIHFTSHWPGRIINLADIVLAGTFLFVCRRLSWKKGWIPLLIAAQYIPILWMEFTGKIPEAHADLMIDNLAIIMALVIGIVGGLIAIYTVGYMKEYHKEHPEIPDNTNKFLAAVFLFFSAMYGIVFSNNIAWLYFFWEITTLCSFLMISYSREEIAFNNAFRALWMLMVGGLAFAIAIIYCAQHLQTSELSVLLKTDKAVVLLPVVLLCFAGLNKAAQLPFSSWLLGAMVAPTPSSALLHSSTMVKAGVYLCIRCAPVLEKTMAGTMLALIGGLTFLLASAIAVSESNAKRVLAYSTVANLGLIILCAGIGTPILLWAAIMLIIFHALAKALLFLAVGKIDQQIGSLDIEDMRGLISRRRRLAILMLVGMAGMFLAPFGMLISKWAVLEALAGQYPILVTIVIFGSSLMLFFWSKWMGAIVSLTGKKMREAHHILFSEWLSMNSLALLTILVCALFPLIGNWLITPLYGMDHILHRGTVIIVISMMSLAVLLPLGFLYRWRGINETTPYLGGANVANRHHYLDSFGKDRSWHTDNYYLEKQLGEKRLLSPANLAAIIIILIMFAAPTL